MAESPIRRRSRGLAACALSTLIFSTCCICVPLADEANAQPGGLLPLVGQVHDELGNALPGVAITVLLGEERDSRTDVSDAAGRFDLMLPAGSHELRAELDGFDTVVLQEVLLSPQSESPAELSIMLDSRFDEIESIPGLAPDALTTVDHAPGSEPRPIPAPSLEVSFRLAGPVGHDAGASGLVRLTNVGAEPVLIPTRPRAEGERYRSQFLALNLTVHATGDSLLFYDWYFCSPGQGDCRSLAPAKAIELPVVLWQLAGSPIDSRGQRLTGRFEGSVAATLILPGTDQITEPVEADFSLESSVVDE